MNTVTSFNQYQQQYHKARKKLHVVWYLQPPDVEEIAKLIRVMYQALEDWGLFSTSAKKEEDIIGKIALDTASLVGLNEAKIRQLLLWEEI